MSDNGLATLVRESVADIHAATPVSEIISRGRAVRTRRRVAAAAGFGVAAVAAVSALVVGVTGGVGPSPNRSPDASPSPRSTDGIRTVGFVLTANANGTLTLTMSKVLDPAALQQALARHGVAALVKTDSYCTSHPAAPDPVRVGVLSMNPPFPLIPAKPGAAPAPLTTLTPGQGPRAGQPDALAGSIANTKLVINPANMPKGTELFFGYAPDHHLITADLIYTHSYSCSSQPPTAAPKGH